MSYEEQWNISYENKDNYLFYPNEEVLRFISKYIRKRIGLNEFTDKFHGTNLPKVLDVGCGIGRHVKLLADFKLDAYGIDFSSSAIEAAKKITDRSDKLLVASVEKIPFENSCFNFALSHGVFDSMPFEIAKKGMMEVHRCLAKDGIFYLDLISGDDSSHFAEYEGEQVVNDLHELGTVQSYFNWEKINKLLQGKWVILESVKVKRESMISLNYYSRYHLILKKIEG